MVPLGIAMMLLTMLLTLGISGVTSNLVDHKSNIKPISVPALGRPFSLGDLYDRRRDLIIPGPKIWSNKELMEFAETPSHSTHFEVSNALNIDEGLSKFDIKASVKMSFLSGLISVAGSAAYLHDKPLKTKQARVALKYSSTTFKRAIKPVTFTKATYTSVLKKVTDATDVVAAIQYGAGAVFVFDRDLKSTETKRTIEGMLKISVKKIPSFNISGMGRVNISSADRKMTDTFTCKFHGDFVLKEHPSNYEEAIKVYKSLPSLLGEKYENSVPVKVWLYPLEMLPLDKSPIALHDIRENLITSVADELEEMENLIRKANDILVTFVADHHTRIRRNVEDFKDYVSLFMIDYKQKLASLLPDIRDGIKDSKALIELSATKERSPFSANKLENWISLYIEEVFVLSTLSDLPNYCKNDGDFSSRLLNRKQYTVSLTLKLNSQDDNQLKGMKRYLQTGENNVFLNENKNKWWNPGHKVFANLQKYTTIFRKYQALEDERVANGVGSNIQFVVREEILKNSDDKVEVTIDLYENGKLKYKDFQIPSTAHHTYIHLISRSHNGVHLTWDPPSEGERYLSHYSVVVYVPKTNKNDSRECDKHFCKVFSVSTLETHIEIVGLEAQKSYAFELETYGTLGKSSKSAKTFLIQTTSCPVGMYHTDAHHCEKCEPGEYANQPGSLSCLKCPPGHYSNDYNTSICTKCPAGTYNEIEGGKLSDCLKCPGGFYGLDVGATTYSACKACPVGTYNTNSGMTDVKHCLICPKGSYGSNDGEMHCHICPFGSQTESVGSTSPKACKTEGTPMGKIEKSVTSLESSAVVKVKEAGGFTKKLNKTLKTYADVAAQVFTSLGKRLEQTVLHGEELLEKYDSK